MEGISKEELIGVKENMPDCTSKLFVHTLITMCKELPDGQWQTIDEFKDSGFVGLCWIFNNDGHVFAHHYDGEYFINPYMPNYPIHNDRIHSVMPIKTPEAPK